MVHRALFCIYKKFLALCWIGVSTRRDDFPILGDSKPKSVNQGRDINIRRVSITRDGL